MKPLTLSNPEIIFGIQDEIRRTEEARYDHRLHAVLLIGQGMTCPQVAKKFGDARGSIRNWVNQFEKEGFAGLVDRERCGRPPRLNEKQLQEIGRVLRRVPTGAGIAQNFWDGKTLAQWIKSRYGKVFGVRQCQRMFHKLGFRLRKPRPMVAFPDSVAREELKKTSKNPEERGG